QRPHRRRRRHGPHRHHHQRPRRSGAGHQADPAGHVRLRSQARARAGDVEHLRGDHVRPAGLLALSLRAEEARLAARSIGDVDSQARRVRVGRETTGCLRSGVRDSPLRAVTHRSLRNPEQQETKRKGRSLRKLFSRSSSSAVAPPGRGHPSGTNQSYASIARAAADDPGAAIGMDAGPGRFAADGRIIRRLRMALLATAMRARLIGGLGLAALAAAAASPTHAQLPLAVPKSSGQTVTPAFEGWYRNSDGTFSISFGYYNRNAG